MKHGIITAVSGPVVDVRFPDAALPPINDALTLELGGGRCTM